MNSYALISSKKEKNVIGILSGTSVDGVDVVLVKISNSGVSSKIKVVDFESFPINNKLKKFILRCSSKKESNVEEICMLNFIIGKLFADSINKFLKSKKILNKKIDLIGSHGQTIYHNPDNNKIFGFNTKSTLQIGEPSVIANQTGILTIGDFRVADVAVNGEGAPLVPYLDFILFRNKNKNRALVNIGGISNATFLKKSCRQNEVIAFDTGPGNMMIDYIAKKFFNKKFDDNGHLALTGIVNDDLFKFICIKDKFYKKNPPKSTGREYYNKKFIEVILNKFNKLKSRDIIATFTKFTAYAIFHNLKKFSIDQLILSGGGTKNVALMNFITHYFKNTEVKIINENGITADNKEAVLFAVLANELISGNKTNITSVTGSQRNVFLGKICLA